MTSTQSQTNPNHQRRTTKWFEKSHVVVIGINKYRYPIESLNTAVNDARKIARILKQEHSFEEQYFLLDEKATLKNIKLLLNNIKKIIKKSDRLIFYYAGHGIALPSDNENSKPQGYLIPQDAEYGKDSTYLSMSYLLEKLSDIECRHGLIILDCCYAGAIRWSGLTRQSGRAKTIYPTTLDTYINRQAWHILTSSDEHQEANDVLLEKNLQENNRDSKEQKHSPFAKCLIEGLGGEADLFPPKQENGKQGDDIITVQELALYLHSIDITTAKAGSEKRQTPQLLPFPKKHKNGQFVFLLNNFETIKNNLPSDPKIADKDNPYRGLKSYDEEDKDVFFGRTNTIKELCQKVHTSGLTVVLGASGSGKSSLVKAGLIPHLKQTDQNQWFTRVMRPNESPVTELATILNDSRFNSALTSKDGTKCLLVIDQFEELVTQCRDQKEREKFWLKFVSLIEQEYQLHIVVTLRSDFESTIRKQFEQQLNKPTSESHTTKLNWIDARFLVKPIEPQQLKEVIKSPAETKAVDFTEEQRDGRTLVQQLIHEVTGMPGALPLLSFALQEIYHELAKRFNQAEKSGENLPKREIIWDDYDKLKGGVPQSITRRATEEYNSLRIDDEGNELNKAEKQARQTMLKWIMLRMVAMTGDGLARRRVSLSELKYPEPNNKYVDFIIERFVNARLLTRGETETDTFVEPSHDALIREWTKINDWLNEEFNVRQISWLDYLSKVLIGSEYQKTFFSKFQKTKLDLQMQRELTTASSNWLNNQKTQGDEKAVGFLWNEDPRLPFLYYIFSSGSNWFNQAETDFIQRSEQKRQNDLCRIVSGIILAIASTSFFAVWTSYNGQQANLRAKAANVRNLTSDKPFDALFLAWEAVNQPLSDSVVEVRSSLLSAVETPKERNRLDQKSPVPFVAVLKDEQIVSSTENEILLWDKNSNWERKSLWQSDNNNEIVSLDVCSNNLVLSTNDQNNNVQVYYLPDLKQNSIEQLPIKNNFTQVFAVSSDCEIIAVGNDSQVQLLNKKGQTLGEPFYHNNVTAVAISPDRNYIAMANNDEYTDDIKVQKIPYSSKENSVSHSQQNFEGSKSNTNTSSVKTVSLSFFSQTPPPLAPPTSIPSNKPFFNETSPATKPPLDETLNDTPPPLDIPTEVSPDLCYDSATQKLVDCDSNLIPLFFNHGGGVSTIAFSPDSKRLVSGDSDGTLRFWNIDNKKQIDPPLQRHDGAVTSIAFSPDGTFIVSGSRDNSLRLWDIDGNQIGQPLQGHESWLRDVAVARDTKSIISSSNDGTIRLWGVNQENLINLSSQNYESIEIKEVALSKDGRVVATNDGYPILRYKVASDNDNFAQNCTDGEYRLKLWSKGKFAQSPTSEFHSCEINAIAISDDGKISVSGGADGKIILWDEEGNLIDRKNISTDRENTEVTAIAIAHDGQSVVSGTRDGKIQLWQIKDQKLAKSPKLIECDDCKKRISAIAFSHDGKLIASGSHDNIVRLWNTQGKLVKEFKGHNLPIESVTFSHDGKLIASGSQDNTVRLWKTKTSIVNAITSLWNTQQEQVGKPLQGHKGWVSAIAFSPDDRFIATGSWDNTVRLWDSFGNLMGSPFRGHTEWISSIRFSSDGKSIISGSADKTIRCWQAGDPQDWLKKAEEQLQEHSDSPNVLNSTNNDSKRTSLNICQTKPEAKSKSAKDHLSPKSSDSPSFPSDLKGEVCTLEAKFKEQSFCGEHAPENNPSTLNPSFGNLKSFSSPALQDFAPALRAIAQDYYKRGNEEADKKYLKNFDKILNNSNTNAEKAEAYINKGVIHFRRQEYDRAIEEYDLAIELDFNNISAYINRGITYSSKEQHEQAIKDYNQAIVIDQANVDAYISRGIAHSGLGNHNLAIEDYDRAISLAPNNADAYYAKGFTLALQEENKSKAIQAYQEAAKLYRRQRKTDYSQSAENQIEQLK